MTQRQRWLRRLDPIRWRWQVGLTVSALSLGAAVLIMRSAEDVWVTRLALFGGFAFASAIMLRGAGLWRRDIAVLLVVSVAGGAVFRYMTHGLVMELGQILFLIFPWLLVIGVGRAPVLGTLAPGRYGELPPADEKIVRRLQSALGELTSAVHADEARFSAHIARAHDLAEIETTDTGWMEVGELMRSVISYIRGDEGEPEADEYFRRLEASVGKYKEVLNSRKVWYGRFGRPTARAAKTT